MKGSLYRPERSIPARIGITGTPNADPVIARFEPYPEVCHHGVVHAAVLALLIDMGGGWIADREAGEDWVFTSDLSLRAPNLVTPTAMVGKAYPLRRGRGTITTEVIIEDEHGAPYAYGQAEFVRMPARPGDPPKPSMDNAEFRRSQPRPLERPLVEMFGCETRDPVHGIIEVALRDELRNPAGAMQGGMVALAAQCSAEALAAHHLGGPFVVTDMDIRFLRMGRAGPIHSQASFIGPPATGTIRVDLHDAGAENRLVSTVLTRVASAP